MSDIALIWNEDLGGADFAITAGDLEVDDGLETAVMLSLFLNRRAEPTDALPTNSDDLGGWWADDFPVVPGDLMGSRLWLLSREKASPSLASRAQEYAREALDWLVTSQIAQSVDVLAQLLNETTLLLSVAVTRPGKGPANFRYQYVWAAQAARGA